MADGDGGERGRGEQLLQPLDAGQVKVVGGLVQQHHFRFADQSLSNRQPLAPAATERGGLVVEVNETGAAPQLSNQALAQPPLPFALIYVRCGQRPLQNLPDAEAGRKTRVLGHVGGAGAFAHGQLA